MARDAETTQAAALWTWSAIAGGVVAALIIQAILTMLALGVVLRAGTVTSGSAAIVTNMAGPAASLNTRIATYGEPRATTGGLQTATALDPEQIEQTRKAFATTLLASFVGLLAGALAAAIGGWWSRDLAEELRIPTGASRSGASTR